MFAELRLKCFLEQVTLHKTSDVTSLIKLILRE